ncbi:hypothetical protein [Rhodoplanes roseus]|uniref:TIGR02301 family protein n=1 Tax=Rhodoplanes roseus TaxID=29409 RepID=A0A327KP42_9BRAD|nr:hypothetical protein [Rhodoplanes roseus]RAI40131.1 hypothetical protein CH341_24415 [Rhodoplanes roseus]
MSRWFLTLAVLLVMSASTWAQPAEPPARPGHGFLRIADLPARTLAVAYFSVVSLESCYLGSVRAISRAELDEAIRMVREVEKAVVALRPDLDTTLLYQDAVRLGFQYYATSRDPAPWICARDLTAILETHRAATTGECPVAGVWPNCR